MSWQDILNDTWQTSLVFFSLLLFTRLLGKTQVGQLTFYEYVNGITIGSIGATIVASEQGKLWDHFYDLILFVILTYIISLLSIKSRPLRKIIEGSPTIVIENGHILKDNMGNIRYDLDELHSQLRQQGILDVSEVQYAILETTGDLSVIKKSAYQNLTKGDIHMHFPNPMYPVELIMDGEIIADNLKREHLTADWLKEQLALQNIAHESEVTYAGIDSRGHLFVNRKTTDSVEE